MKFRLKIRTKVNDILIAIFITYNLLFENRSDAKKEIEAKIN